jgi:cellulose biosynthesis protein BcsQ
MTRSVPGGPDVRGGRSQRDVAALEKRLREAHEERKLTMGPGARRALLDSRLAIAEVGYDFVLVDTPTGFGEITTKALEPAHLVLSPIDMKSADNVESVTDLLEHMQEVARKPVVYFVPNRYVARERQCRAGMARAQGLCGPRLSTAVLPECTAVPQAMTEQRELVASSATAAALSEAVWQLGQVVIGHASDAVFTAGGASV